MPPTKQGTLGGFEAMRASIPDLRMDIEDMIAEGDKVFIRATMSGTQQGEFGGIPATGRHFKIAVADFLRLRDGRAVEHWGVTDSGAMLKQLGIMEALG